MKCPQCGADHRNLKIGCPCGFSFATTGKGVVPAGKSIWKLPGLRILIGALLIGGAAILSISSIHDRSQWATVDGRVQTSELIRETGSAEEPDVYYWLTVGFAYEVDGVRYWNEQDWLVASYNGWFPSKRAQAEDKAQVEKSRFLVGAAVPVHVDPKLPANAVVELKGRSRDEFFAGKLGYLVGICGLLLIFGLPELASHELTTLNISGK